MTESALSIAYNDLLIEVGSFLALGANPSAFTVAQLAEVDRYVQAGVRQFYYPPAIEGVPPGHEWSFLHPTTTITTIQRYTTGSLAVVGGTCTITGGTWPTWAATHGTLVINDVEYAITSRDSGAELTVVGDDDTAAADEWYLSHSGAQDLPDDFGRVLGNFEYDSSDQFRSVPVVSEAMVLSALSGTRDESHPTMAATRFKAQVAGSGQRNEVVWFPVPDAEYELTYRYEAYSGKLTTLNPYPLGGMRYSELITESCLAMAEQRANDRENIHTQAFRTLLVDAISRDKKQGARYFGPMSPVPASSERPRVSGVNYPITYKGITW
jgi:hypothetical protein